MRQATICITKEEYKNLKEKAELNENLLIKLVKGLEEIATGKVKPWRKVISV